MSVSSDSSFLRALPLNAVRFVVCWECVVGWAREKVSPSVTVCIRIKADFQIETGRMSTMQNYNFPFEAITTTEPVTQH